MFSLQHFLRFKSIDQYFTKTIKNRSRRILRLWTDHCEYIVAQRIRRSQQMICLYRRIWDEQALRWIVQQLRKQVSRSTSCAERMFLPFYVMHASPNIIAN